MIEEFYQAFKELDAEKMVSYYHPEVVFVDPAFGELKGDRAKNMWRMLIDSQKGKQFDIDFFDVEELDFEGSAYWEAKYKFSLTGRVVHNKIKAQFIIQDGLIIKHIDSFEIHNWAKQALGLKGILLGGTVFFKKKLNAQTNRMLDKYEVKNRNLNN
jgi:hypothetical protein